MLKISAIIPSHNGADRLPAILESIGNQERKIDEIIIVVDGSTDNTVEVLNKPDWNLNLKTIVQKNSGRAATRNNGANAATGDLLLFYDDDTRPEPNSAKLHELLHLKNEKAVCSGFTIEDEHLLKSDFAHFKRYLSIKWTQKYQDGLNKVEKKNLFLTAANMSIRKTHFDALDGFNTNLTDAEDYELAIRAYKDGMDIFFDKSNIAWHDDLVSCRQYIRRQREYFKARFVLDKTIPKFFRREKLEIGLLKAFFFRLFANSFVVNMIDSNRLAFLPRRIRYKIYDIAITGCSTLDSD